MILTIIKTFFLIFNALGYKSRNDYRQTAADLDGLVALHSAVELKLTMLTDAATAIESKLFALFAGGLVVITLVIGGSKSLTGSMIVGIYLLTISIIFSLLGCLPKEYPTSAVSIKEHPEYVGMYSRKLLLQLISNNELSVRKIQAINNEKTKVYIFSWIAFGVGAALILGTMFIKLVRV